MQVGLKSMQKELWEKEAERLYFVQGITINDWLDFIRKIITEAKEEARNELVKEFIETGGISFTVSMTTEYNKIKGSKGTS